MYTLLKEGTSSSFLISVFLRTRMERLSRATMDHIGKRWSEPPDKRSLGPSCFCIKESPWLGIFFREKSTCLLFREHYFAFLSHTTKWLS